MATKKPAAGTIKEIKEPEGPEGQAMVPGGGGNGQQQRPNGLQVMSEKDVNAYMETLLEVQQPPADMPPIELGALAQFRGISQDQGNIERQLTRAQSQVEALKTQMARLQGQSEAYVNLLVLAEDSRRVEAARS